MTAVATWAPVRLRHLVEVNPRVRQVPGDVEVPFVPMEALGDGAIDLTTTRPAGDVRGSYAGFEPDDVVVAKVTPCFENGKTAVVPDHPAGVGYGTTELTVLRAGPRVDARFLGYVVQEENFRQGAIAAMTGAGGLRRVPDDYMRDYALAVPPLEEQRAIVEYLDPETARINALISKQERLIETLDERRVALMAELVQVPRPGKPTPVPPGWEVGELRRFAEVVIGKMIPGGEVDGYVSAPYLRAAHVQPQGRLDLSDVKEMPFSPEELRRLDLRAGDVVVVEGGAGYGRSALLEEDLVGWGFQKSINRIRVRGGDSRYVNYALQAAAAGGVLDFFLGVATIPHLTAEKLRLVPLAWPPRGAQREIADRIDRETSEIRRLVRAARQAVILLRERRRALVSAAVTGRIDVRGH